MYGKPFGYIVFDGLSLNIQSQAGSEAAAAGCCICSSTARVVAGTATLPDLAKMTSDCRVVSGIALAAALRTSAGRPSRAGNDSGTVCWAHISQPFHCVVSFHTCFAANCAQGTGDACSNKTGIEEQIYINDCTCGYWPRSPGAGRRPQRCAAWALLLRSG